MPSQVEQRPHREAVGCNPARGPGAGRDGAHPSGRGAGSGVAGGQWPSPGTTLPVKGHRVQDFQESGGAAGSRRAGSSNTAGVGARCGWGSPWGLGTRRGTARPGGDWRGRCAGRQHHCSSSFSTRNPERHSGGIDRVRGPLPQPLPLPSDEPLFQIPYFLFSHPTPLHCRLSLPVPVSPEPALIARSRSPEPALPARSLSPEPALPARSRSPTAGSRFVFPLPIACFPFPTLTGSLPVPSTEGRGVGVFRGEPASRSNNICGMRGETDGWKCSDHPCRLPALSK